MRQLRVVAGTLDDVDRYGAPVTRDSCGALRVEEKGIIRPDDQLHVAWVLSEQAGESSTAFPLARPAKETSGGSSAASPQGSDARLELFRLAVISSEPLCHSNGGDALQVCVGEGDDPLRERSPGLEEIGRNERKADDGVRMLHRVLQSQGRADRVADEVNVFLAADHGVEPPMPVLRRSSTEAGSGQVEDPTP